MPAAPPGSEPAMVSATGDMTSAPIPRLRSRQRGEWITARRRGDQGRPRSLGRDSLWRWHAMNVDVYETDADVFDAVAALVAEALRSAAATGRATIALSGGRGGRGVMVALAGRGDVPWDRVDWFWGDERCVAPDDPRSNVRLARESLLAPR